MERSGAKNKPKTLTLVDAIVALGLLVFTLLYQLGRWKGAVPFVFLDGDAGNISSFSAAFETPQAFQGDAVLADPQNFRIYSTIHLPLLRALIGIFGDYGSAVISLLWLHVFLQGMGFYLLGRLLFQSRYWAALLAIATLMPVALNLGEFWGVHIDPLPRFSFQALLPYLLAAAFYWRAQPKAWPWLMAGAGALIYIHPVSAPAWGAALWMGLWASRPMGWTFLKRLGYMALCGFVFFLVIAPFFIHYLQNHAHGAPKTSDYQHIYEILVLRFSEAFLDVGVALKDFFSLWTSEWYYWAWAAVGILGVLWLRREDRKSPLVLVLWVMGLMVVSVAIPWVDQCLSRAYGWIPLQLDLIRNIRYLVPLMLLWTLWPLVEATKKLKSVGYPGMAIAIATVGFFIVGGWAYRHPLGLVGETLSCWNKGQMVCMPKEWSAAIDALKAVRRETPPGAKILPTAYPLAIRYYAFRPVVYAYKDFGILAYTNHAKLFESYEIYKEMRPIELAKDPEAKLSALVSLGKKLGVQYLLVDFTLNPLLAHFVDAEVVWANDSFSIWRLQDRAEILQEKGFIEKAELASSPSPYDLNDPSKLIDGKLATGWLSIPSEYDSGSRELRFDLGQARTVNRLTLFSWADNYAFPKDWSLEASPDGQEWQPVSLTPRPTKETEIAIFHFLPLQARYFKLKIVQMPRVSAVVLHPTTRWPGFQDSTSQAQMGIKVQSQAGCPERSFVFSQGPESYVQLADAPQLRPSQLTLSIWFRVRELDGQIHTLMRQGQSEHAGYWLAWENRAGLNHIWWEVGDGHDGMAGRPLHFHVLEAPVNLKPGEWVQVTASFDGSEMKLYRGNELIGEGGHAAAIEYKPGELFIGSSDTTGLRGFNGEIAQALFYDQNLNLNEIEELAELPRGGCWETRPVEGYRFGFKEIRLGFEPERK